MTSVVSRRNVIGSLAATSAMPLWPLFALAASTTSHSFKFGAFEISVVSDGHMTVPTRFLARNVSEREIKYWLGQSADMVTPATNVTLVRTPLDLILIDVGAGPHFMPTVGKLAENMETAGIDRKAVTKVVITHAHPDHLWGTLERELLRMPVPRAALPLIVDAPQPRLRGPGMPSELSIRAILRGGMPAS